MKNSNFALAFLAGTFLAVAAQANNATVENALKSRPELSTFYSGLISTGVINELHENQPYTVFAPTNDAFAKLTQEKYPCFYSADCKAQVAEVLRRHIVPGEKHLEDMNANASHKGGGLDSLFSIDNQHLVATQADKDKFTVDGENVTSENQLLGGVLYKLDGVLASDHDLQQFAAAKVLVVPSPMVHEAGTDLPPHVPEGKIVTLTTTDSTTPIPY